MAPLVWALMYKRGQGCADVVCKLLPMDDYPYDAKRRVEALSLIRNSGHRVRDLQ